jgi:hypothetical protein
MWPFCNLASFCQSAPTRRGVELWRRWVVPSDQMWPFCNLASFCQNAPTRRGIEL